MLVAVLVGVVLIELDLCNGVCEVPPVLIELDLCNGVCEVLREFALDLAVVEVSESVLVADVEKLLLLCGCLVAELEGLFLVSVFDSFSISEGCSNDSSGNFFSKSSTDTRFDCKRDNRTSRSSGASSVPNDVAISSRVFFRFASNMDFCNSFNSFDFSSRDFFVAVTVSFQTLECHQLDQCPFEI